MSRAVLTLSTPDMRQKAALWVAKAPAGSRVEFKGPKRSTDQNSRLWAMLTDVATQATHQGNKYSTGVWKALFMHAFGHETRFIPTLNGEGFLPIAQSSSDLSKKEMSELLDLIEAWGTEQGVIFHDETPVEKRA